MCWPGHLDNGVDYIIEINDKSISVSTMCYGSIHTGNGCGEGLLFIKQFW